MVWSTLVCLTGLVNFSLFDFSLVKADVTNKKHDDMLSCCATKNMAIK